MMPDTLAVSAARPSAGSPRVLMCRPQHFDVLYEINAFMEGNVRRVDPNLAAHQWEVLYRAVEDAGARIELLDSNPELPDLVFTANGGFVWGSQVVLPRFAHPERRGEEPSFRDWFCGRGYTTVQVPESEFFEGEGDVVVRDSLLFMGCHSRTTSGTASTLTQITGLEVIPVRLNPRGFYHIDTCMFSVSPSGLLLYYPEAFTPEDRRTIVERVGKSRCVEINPDEATRFACNTLVVGDTAISPRAPSSYAAKLKQVGLRSVMVDLSEFMKAGGAAKCLVLRLGQA